MLDSSRALAAPRAFAALVFAAAGASHAQQNVPFANGIPVAPEMPIPPMPDRPVEYPTAEGQRIRVSVVTRGISHPWSIAFLPNDVWLVTQTHGGLRVVRDGVLDPDARRRRARGQTAAPLAACSRSRCIRVSPTTSSSISTYHKGLAGRQRRARARARPLGRQGAASTSRDLFVDAARLRHACRA